MKVKYAIKEINPDVHRSGQYLIDNHDGVYLSGGAIFARDIHFFDSKEDAMDYTKWHLQQRYVEIVEVYYSSK